MKGKSRIPSGFTIRRRLLSILMVMVMTLGYMPTMGFGPTKAWAAAGDVPDHKKNIVYNENEGTYTISLDVVGEAEKKPNNVNVLVILDRSGSMSNTTSGTTRMSAAKNAVNSFSRANKFRILPSSMRHGLK